MKYLMLPTIMMSAFNPLATAGVVTISNTPALINPTAHVVQSSPKENSRLKTVARFQFASCTKFKFSTELMSSFAGVVDVAIKVPSNQTECFGTTVTRSYELPLSDDALGAVRFVNPVAPQWQDTITDANGGSFKACTADAGIMFNPLTGSCEGYSNGCEAADLKEAGYQYAQPEQCQ